MSRESLVFVAGLLLIFLPVIGVPSAWKEYALWTIGGLLMIIGLSLRRSSYLRKINQGNGELRADSFVESQPSLLDSAVPPTEGKKV